MTGADYKCVVCGFRRDFYFERTPPPTHHQYHDNDLGQECHGSFNRVWTAPHLGAMSSGEPPR